MDDVDKVLAALAGIAGAIGAFTSNVLAVGVGVVLLAIAVFV